MLAVDRQTVRLSSLINICTNQILIALVMVQKVCCHCLQAVKFLFFSLLLNKHTFNAFAHNCSSRLIRKSSENDIIFAYFSSSLYFRHKHPTTGAPSIKSSVTKSPDRVDWYLVWGARYWCIGNGNV